MAVATLSCSGACFADFAAPRSVGRQYSGQPCAKEASPWGGPGNAFPPPRHRRLSTDADRSWVVIFPCAYHSALPLAAPIRTSVKAPTNT